MLPQPTEDAYSTFQSIRHRMAGMQRTPALGRNKSKPRDAIHNGLFDPAARPAKQAHRQETPQCLATWVLA